MNRYFTLTGLFLCVYYFFSQNIYFPVYHYESENGLIHLNVLSVQQDNKKILKIVTQGGVYEYEGKTFIKKQEYSALKNIRNIFFNDTALFLIHRDKGLFYINKNKTYPFLKNNPFKKPSDKIILNNQYIYNYTDQISVEVYDYKNQIYSNDSLLIKDNFNQAYCIAEINHKILVGRKKGLYIMDAFSAKLLPQLSKTPVFSIFHNHITKQIYLGSADKIIIIDDSLFNVQRIIPINISLPNKSNQFLIKMEKNISKLLVDKYNRIWFSIQPDDNLYLIDNNQIYDVFDVMNISPVLINEIYLDSFNNIWTATFNEGLYQINSNYWQSFKIEEFNKTLNIRMMERNKTSLIYATNNGLYYADKNQPNKLKNIVAPDNFFNNEIYSIEKFNQQIFCSNITAFDTKKFLIDKTNLWILPFKYSIPKNLTECYVSDITNNVLIFSLTKNKITDTIFKPSDYKLVIRHLFYFNQQLFIATNKGVFVIDEQTKRIAILLKDSEVQKSVVIENKLFFLYENKIYDYTNNKIFFDAEKYNLITLTDIEKWKEYYFISSEEGLLLLDKNLAFVNFFSRKNGLISNVINDVLISDNTIYLATDKGISYTNINNLLQTDISLNPPLIDYIYTNSDSFPYHANQSLRFSKDIQDIYFHIVCPNYNPLTKITFQYSLNNSEWINFENTPLHFSSLKGGNYTLKIRASTDNIHFTEPYIISFSKELSLYEKSWFWEFIVVTGIIIILISVIIIRKIETKKSAEKLKNIQQMNLLKHQAMNAILSPHFIFNSLTGIQNYILKNDAEKASDYLSKFSRLIRMIIEKASQSTINLQDEIKRLQFYLELEKERFQDKFDFKIIIDENIDTEHTIIPNMIIQPYLENAILHGILPKKEKGNLLLSFRLKDNKFLEIIIDDDGIGIMKGEERKPKHHKSLATQTISEILNINTQLYQKQQSVQIIDKSTIQANQSGTIVKILIEL